MITTQGLARSFAGRGGRERGAIEAVGGLDLQIGEGEIVALLGPNGAGKTTTVRMLATLLTPSAGTAQVAGYDVVHQRPLVRERIGYISQAGGAGPDQRVLDELRSHAELHGMRRRAAACRAGEMVEAFDLGGLERRVVKSLSGGQRRRLDLAMGLLHSPQVIFLDEPTTGLDPHSRANLWDRLRELHRDRRATVLLTTHYLDEADALCDRVIVIDGGKVIADDRPDELKAQVAGDMVILQTEQITDTVRVLSRVVPDSVPDTAPGTVRVQVPHAHLVLCELLRGLDEADVRLGSVNVQQPSLEDVFLRITGRTLNGSSARPVTLEHSDVSRP
jgi:ABC-2 type transport system ATP-binding protein